MRHVIKLLDEARAEVDRLNALSLELQRRHDLDGVS